MSLIPKEKQYFRKFFLEQREAIPFVRRQKATEALMEVAPILTATHHFILSYASFKDEFCTKAFNHYLEEEEKLCLPRVHGDQLKLYMVTDSATQLEMSIKGILEPNPLLCESISPDLITLALVPGIAFDARRHRLGYGKGYYDRLLGEFDPSCHTVGLGFEEQFSLTPLPIEETDRELEDFLLF